MAWSQIWPGAVEMLVAADELGHVYVMARRNDEAMVVGDQTFDTQSHVLVHLDAAGEIVAARSLDIPVAGRLEFLAAPGGGVIFGARYGESFRLNDVDIEVVGAGLFIASLPPDLR